MPPSSEVQRSRVPAKLTVSRGLSRDRRDEILVGYLFLLPDFLGLILFWLGPMVYVLYLSFFKWNALTEPTFTGLSNFRALLTDEVWWRSLTVTGVYIGTFVPLSVGLGLAVAVLLSSKIRFVTHFRTAYFIPYAISLVIGGTIWAYILEPKFGVVNFVLKGLGVAPREWLASPKDALFAVVLVSVWRYFGYYMVLFVAGLQEIPRTYYEAAQIDGATRWQAFRHITWPLLRPVTMFVLVVALIASFQVFDQVYIMTRGGPDRATYVVMYYIYEKAFRFFDFGYASAMSFVLFAIIFVLTLVQMRVFGTDAK